MLADEMLRDKHNYKYNSSWGEHDHTSKTIHALWVVNAVWTKVVD